MNSPTHLHVWEPALLRVCPCPASVEAPLGVRVCAPSAVRADAVRVAHVPHTLALALSLAHAHVLDACLPCATEAAWWAGSGRLVVRAHVLTNAETSAVTDAETNANANGCTRRRLVRTDAGAWVVMPQGRVRWTAAPKGVLELCAVTWCGEPVPTCTPLPALLWDYTAVVQELGWQALGWHARKVPRTPGQFAFAVQQNGYALRLVPDALRTPALCWTAVQQDGSALQWVPDALRTSELCAAAVQQDGLALHFVPEGLRTPTLYAAAVQQHGWALQYVPAALRTPALCTAAVQQHGLALDAVPDALCTPELWVTAFLHAFPFLHYGAVLTPEFRDAAVQRDGLTLANVPIAMRSPALCAAAVQQNGMALRWVPDALRTPELCAAAVRRNGLALDCVSEELRTFELYAAAVQQNGDMLYSVPEPLRTRAVCRAALQRERLHELIFIVLREHLTPELLWDGLEASVTRCVRPQWAELHLT